ncbi:MAG: signal peptidase I [Candidatus Lernaella stagnicola]|nr:signal peptidase I [Candidatus Lernaella stagnicola]
MFVAHRLKKARKEGMRYAKRLRRDLQHPDLFNQPTRNKVERALARFTDQTLASEDPALITRELKQLRHDVDVHLPFHRHSVVREYAEIIIVALLLAMVIRTFIVQAFKIPSASMVPTLLVGDHILVTKSLYGIPIPFTDTKIRLSDPERGDIIVFKWPKDPRTDYIKRIIGLPGDKIEISGTDLYVNGQLVPKTMTGELDYSDPRGYRQDSNVYRETSDENEYTVLYDKRAHRFDSFSTTVPEDHYFCMGDNRDHSKDSRFWGFVPYGYIKGKALIIYFSWPWRQLTRFGHILE